MLWAACPVEIDAEVCAESKSAAWFTIAVSLQIGRVIKAPRAVGDICERVLGGFFFCWLLRWNWIILLRRFFGFAR